MAEPKIISVLEESQCCRVGGKGTVHYTKKTNGGGLRLIGGGFRFRSGETPKRIREPAYKRGRTKKDGVAFPGREGETKRMT